MFLACMFSYMIRTNLSITIVAMVNATSKSGSSGPACTVASASNSSNKTTELKDVSILSDLLFVNILNSKTCCKKRVTLAQRSINAHMCIHLLVW